MAEIDMFSLARFLKLDRYFVRPDVRVIRATTSRGSILCPPAR
jgi:hypothetical protein